jgi:hypothetical protein
MTQSSIAAAFAAVKAGKSTVSTDKSSSFSSAVQNAVAEISTPSTESSNKQKKEKKEKKKEKKDKKIEKVNTVNINTVNTAVKKEGKKDMKEVKMKRIRTTHVVGDTTSSELPSMNNNSTTGQHTKSTGLKHHNKSKNTSNTSKPSATAMYSGSGERKKQGRDWTLSVALPSSKLKILILKRDH